MLRLAAPVALVLTTGCLTVLFPLLPVRVADETALRGAAERFYLAETVAELRQAADDAARAGPNSAVAHELAAAFAQLNGRETQQIDHLVAALQDVSDDQPLLHLHLLTSFDLTMAQRVTVGALLQSLVDRHPSADVRAAAAFHLALMLTWQGDFTRRAQVVESIEARVPLAWVGDQGETTRLFDPHVGSPPHLAGGVRVARGSRGRSL